jgi:hypothetical protein
MRSGRIAALAIAAATGAVGCSGTHGSRPHPGTVGSSVFEAVAPSDPFAACHRRGVAYGSQVEPSLASDPRNPDILLAAWQQDRLAGAGALGIVAAVSTDGGRTWTAQPLPGITSCAGGPYVYASDPEAGIGTDGRMYVASIAEGPVEQAILVSTSSDDGRTWSAPATVTRIPDSSSIIDKPAFLADRLRPSTAYAEWVAYEHPPGVPVAQLRVDTAYLSRSSDGGRHWTGPIRVYGADSENQNHVLAQLADGSVLDVFAEAYRLNLPSGPQSVEATRSADGGTSWSRPVTVGRLPYAVVFTPTGNAPIRASSQDVTSASESSGSVVAAWEDNAPRHTELAVARSTDDGLQWERLADPLDGSVVAFLPSVAADSAGDVGLSWYQVSGGRGYPTTVDFAVLPHGGASWQVRAISSPFPLSRAAPSPEGLFLGDYESLVGQRCGFRALDSVVAGGEPVVETAPLNENC